jgi:hypothetical protein
MQNAAPKLLDALDFQVGDAEKLQRIVSLVDSELRVGPGVSQSQYELGKSYEVLRRYQAMASKLEAKR